MSASTDRRIILPGEPLPRPTTAPARCPNRLETGRVCDADLTKRRVKSGGFGRPTWLCGVCGYDTGEPCE